MRNNIKKIAISTIAVASIFLGSTSTFAATTTAKLPVLQTKIENYTIFVNAKDNWKDTGINIPQNASVTITALGTASAFPGISGIYTPIGGKEYSSRTLVPAAPAYSLVGKIGNNSGFSVGFRYNGTSTNAGNLSLSMNDGEGRFTDNTGYWIANVLVKYKK